MDSGQSPVGTNVDQELESKALPEEETASTFEHKEQSKLAQVCTFSDSRLPELERNILRWISCTNLKLREQKRPLQDSSE